MDSSASEAPASSAASSARILSPPKPNTGADTGTYSCTYHSCAQRFPTPQKLQKHKRDVQLNHAKRHSRSWIWDVGGRAHGAQTRKLGLINVSASTPGPESLATQFSRGLTILRGTRIRSTTFASKSPDAHCARKKKLFSRKATPLTRAHARCGIPKLTSQGRARRRGGARD